MLLGSAAVQRAISRRQPATLAGIPAAATVSVPAGSVGGIPPATVVLAVEVLGLVFIGLLAVAGFSVMAQRRLRALGMLSAIGATERNLRLVMIINGRLGVAGALAGAVLGLAAWFAYVPTLQRAAGHVVDAANLPWWAIATGVVLAGRDVGARLPPPGQDHGPRAGRGRAVRPPRSAESAAPLRRARRHRVRGRRCRAWPSPAVAERPGQPATLLLLGGLVAVVVGIFLLVPLAISVLAAGAGPRLPVAIRIALRDLVRYRARSGAALAATTFAVFLAMAICIVASIKFENPLNWPAPTCPAAS